ncbi:hypothetical protein BDAP_000583 [Binucleata daphniae]
MIFKLGYFTLIQIIVCATQLGLIHTKKNAEKGLHSYNGKHKKEFAKLKNKVTKTHNLNNTYANLYQSITNQLLKDYDIRFIEAEGILYTFNCIIPQNYTPGTIKKCCERLENEILMDPTNFKKPKENVYFEYYKNIFIDHAEFAIKAIQDALNPLKKDIVEYDDFIEHTRRNPLLQKNLIMAINWLNSISTCHNLSFLYNYKWISGNVKDNNFHYKIIYYISSNRFDSISPILPHVRQYYAENCKTIEDQIINENPMNIKIWLQKKIAVDEEVLYECAKTAYGAILLQKVITTKLNFMAKKRFLGCDNTISTIKDLNCKIKHEEVIKQLNLEAQDPDYYAIQIDTFSMLTKPSILETHNVLMHLHKDVVQMLVLTKKIRFYVFTMTKNILKNKLQKYMAKSKDQHLVGCFFRTNPYKNVIKSIIQKYEEYGKDIYTDEIAQTLQFDDNITNHIAHTICSATNIDDETQTKLI